MLGAGGLIQCSAPGGRTVFVVLMTNGDAYQHEQALMLAEDLVWGTAAEHRALGRERQRESVAALAALGIPRDHVICLGYPDGGIHAMWQPPHWSLDQPYRSPHTQSGHNPYPDSLSPGAPHSGQQVVIGLLRVLAETRPTAVFTTASFDIHRDHWGTCGFVSLAVEEYAREHHTSIPLYGFLIHRHGWPAPQGYHPHHPLEPPAAWTRTPDVHWWRLELTAEQVRTKRGCLSDYHTQDAAHSSELLAFVRRNELFSQLDEHLPRAAVCALQDPVGDLPPDRLRPAEDIALVELTVDGGDCVVKLHLAGPPEPELRYALVWHPVAGPGCSAGSVVWHRGGARLLQARPHGRMTEDGLPAAAAGRDLSARLPGEGLQASELLLEAYSQADSRYLDHTMTRLVRLGTRDG